jgi:hypothetical protein
MATSDELLIAAAQAIMTSSALKPAFVDRDIAVDVPQASTLAAPFTVYEKAVGSSGGGSLLASVSIAVDSVFQTDYYWSLFIDGVTGPAGSTFEPFDPTVNTFEAVPSARSYLLDPGAKVKITAYNHGNVAHDGTISVYIAAGTLSAEERKILVKYKSLINKIASEI